jgi:hypothetical protein
VSAQGKDVITLNMCRRGREMPMNRTVGVHVKLLLKLYNNNNNNNTRLVFFFKPYNIKLNEDPLFHYRTYTNGQPKRSSNRHVAGISMQMKLEKPDEF